MFKRGSGQATCVSCVKVLSPIMLYAHMHELKLSTNHFTFRNIGTGFYSNAQTSYATAGCANVSAVLLVDNSLKTH